MKIKNQVRKLIPALLAEFIGTGALVFIFLRVQYSNLPAMYFVAIATALVLAMATFAFVNKSGAHFNPAITIGLWTVRKVSSARAALYIVTQMFGAWAAYELFNFFYVHLATKEVPAAYQNLQSWDLHIFLAEAFGALIFAIGFAAAYKYARNNQSTYAGFVAVAFAIGVMVASIASVSAVVAGLINPAVAEGMRVFHIWSGASWGTYVLGPVVGAIVGFNLYEFFFDRDFGKTKTASAAVAAPAKTASTASKASANRAKKTSTKSSSAKAKKTSRAKK
jgi:glycerol uptake facilitator-like aquaporin